MDLKRYMYLGNHYAGPYLGFFVWGGGGGCKLCTPHWQESPVYRQVF